MWWFPFTLPNYAMCIPILLFPWENVKRELQLLMRRDTPLSKATILPIIRNNLETMQDRTYEVSIMHYHGVAYELSIGTKIGDLEWPWPIVGLFLPLYRSRTADLYIWKLVCLFISSIACSKLKPSKDRLSYNSSICTKFVNRHFYTAKIYIYYSSSTVWYRWTL